MDKTPYSCKIIVVTWSQTARIDTSERVNNTTKRQLHSNIFQQTISTNPELCSQCLLEVAHSGFPGSLPRGSWTASYVLLLTVDQQGRLQVISELVSWILSSTTADRASLSLSGMGYGSLAVGLSWTPTRYRTCYLELSSVCQSIMRTFRIHQDWPQIKGAKGNKSVEHNKNAK